MVGNVPILQADFGKGYVHVFDEKSLYHILTELDTISDFVDYLRRKVEYLDSGREFVMIGQEEDLLALYLHSGRAFPEGADLLVVGDDLWDGLRAKSEWAWRKEAEKVSYIWDGLVETIGELHDPNGATPDAAIDSMSSALGPMASETRFARRLLGEAFNEFLQLATRRTTRARMVPSISGVLYVFLAGPVDEDREARKQELVLRCLAARSRPECKGDTVIGISTNHVVPGAGFSIDAVRVTIPELTEEWRERCRGIQADLGYFAEPKIRSEHVDEYPN
jgi:hypothetical protein